MKGKADCFEDMREFEGYLMLQNIKMKKVKSLLKWFFTYRALLASYTHRDIEI